MLLHHIVSIVTEPYAQMRKLPNSNLTTFDKVMVGQEHL